MSQHRLAHQLGDVDVGRGGDLAGHQHQTGGQQGLARHPALRVVGQQGVEHRVGDLVGHLVGMALGHRLRGEGVSGAHGWIRSGRGRLDTTVGGGLGPITDRPPRSTGQDGVRVIVPPNSVDHPIQDGLGHGILGRRATGGDRSVVGRRWSPRWCRGRSPRPGADTSLATIRSTPLAASLAAARCGNLASVVSAANPTSTWPGCRRRPSSARMSGVGSSTRSGMPSALWILARRPRLGSEVGHRRSHDHHVGPVGPAEHGRLHLGGRLHPVDGDAGRSTGWLLVVTSTTSAPRRAAAVATA